MISSVNSSMPQFVWWMTNHSRVPRSLYDMTSERSASSLARPPAFRMTCASPSRRPASFAGRSARPCRSGLRSASQGQAQALLCRQSSRRRKHSRRAPLDGSCSCSAPLCWDRGPAVRQILPARARRRRDSTASARLKPFVLSCEQRQARIPVLPSKEPKPRLESSPLTNGLSVIEDVHG